MKVPTPIVPTTSAPTGEEGYFQPHDISAGNQQLAQVVNDYSKYVDEQSQKKELFNVSQMVSKEAVDLQQNFQDKQATALPGAPNFTQQLAGEYQARHDALIQSLKDQNYSQDSINEAATRLGALRSSFVAKAIDFQDKSNFAKSASDAQDHALTLSDYARSNPDAVQTTLDEFKGSLAHLGLDPVEQEQIYEQNKPLIMNEARQGYTQMHPDVILKLYGMEPKPGYPGVTDAPNIGTGTGAVGGFDEAAANSLHLEGGYNPADANGSPTNFGINFKANQPELAKMGITAANFRNMTKEQALQLYKNKYWPEVEKLNLPANLQAPFFDVYIRNEGIAKKALAQSGGDPSKFVDISNQMFAPFLKAHPTYAKSYASRYEANKAIATSETAPQQPADNGLVEPGNIDTSSLPLVTDFDKNTSATRPVPYTQDGKTYLIPTILNGAVVSVPDAIAAFKESGQHLGAYKTETQAENAAQNMMAQENGQPPQTTPQTVMGYPLETNPDKSQWDKRADGSTKGTGFLGLLRRPDGTVSSEISVGVEIDGKETEIPLMVPTLSKPELDYLMTHDPESKDFQKNMPPSILQKAEQNAKERIAAGLSPFKQDNEQPAVQPDIQNPEMQLGPDGKTGIPIIDLSTGPERLQMLTLAKTIVNNRTADALATQKAQHEQQFNSFLNGIQDGKYGQTEINSAYQSGLFQSFDERKKAQDVLDEKNKKDQDLASFSTMWSAGQKFNPYDPTAKKAADAGFDRAVQIAQAQGMQTTPLAIGLTEWQRTGILPTKAGVMLRGSLISSDPAQVAEAASVASNMLKQNPNAFAGVDGGDDIGKAAAMYEHNVDDLGMTAEEAANSVALANSPEKQKELTALAPQRQALGTTIIGNSQHAPVDVQKIILGSPGILARLDTHFAGTTPQGFSQPQLAEAQQTYLELALDHFDKYHDAGAAQNYAARQMQRLYGVEGGRLMKFPPSRAYPQIMGSNSYIYDQAKTFVDQYAKRSIPTSDIWLQPTASGSTAEAFRAGRAPPYEIHYTTHEDGQNVYHVVPGKVFVADVEQARQAAALKARQREAQIRSVSNQPFQPLPVM